MGQVWFKPRQDLVLFGTGLGKIGSSWVKFNWVRLNAHGIHKIVKRNALDESDFFCITFYGFWSKTIFKIEIAPTEWILGNIFLDLISLESRVSYHVNSCHMIRICTKHFESRGNVTFFYQIKIYLTVKRPRGWPRLANINNDTR